MSQQLKGFLGALFGSFDSADCCICFHVATEKPPPSGSYPRLIGEPLPAHKLILRGGSERFRAHIERWGPLEPGAECAVGPGHKRIRLSTASCTGDDQRTGGGATRVQRSVEGSNSSGGGDSGGATQESALPSPVLNRQGLPKLMVPLDREDELTPSMEAIRFIYTGSLAAKGQAHEYSAGELVRIRRQAEYLQVQGCTEACDKALVECFNRSSSSTTTSTSSPLAPVLELYSCRHLLPSAEGDDPRVRAVLAACRQYLVSNWGAPLPAAPRYGTAQPAPTKAEILAWLLGGGDAVRIANDPGLTAIFLALPVGAVEELLQSDHLSTDDEATVVALVEEWIAAKGSAATKEDKVRVRRQLRLVNCNTSYLFDVLPKLPWLGLDPVKQAAFMARCRLTDRSNWKQHGSQMGGYDTSSPWYGNPRPQSVPERGVSYKWEVSREDLMAALRKDGGTKELLARFPHADINNRGGGNGSSVTALGFDWRLEVATGKTHAGLFMQCHPRPAVTRQAGKLHGGASVSFRVVVCGGAAGDKTFTLSNEMVKYRRGWGWPEALPLAQCAEPGQQLGCTVRSKRSVFLEIRKIRGSGRKIRSNTLKIRSRGRKPPRNPKSPETKPQASST